MLFLPKPERGHGQNQPATPSQGGSIFTPAPFIAGGAQKTVCLIDCDETILDTVDSMLKWVGQHSTPQDFNLASKRKEFKVRKLFAEQGTQIAAGIQLIEPHSGELLYTTTGEEKGRDLDDIWPLIECTITGGPQRQWIEGAVEGINILRQMPNTEVHMLSSEPLRSKEPFVTAQHLRLQDKAIASIGTSKRKLSRQYLGLPEEHVHMVGPGKKNELIEGFLSQNYNVVFFDDSYYNLGQALEIETPPGRLFCAHHAHSYTKRQKGETLPEGAISCANWAEFMDVALSVANNPSITGPGTPEAEAAVIENETAQQMVI